MDRTSDVSASRSATCRLHVSQTSGIRESALLVRGVDEFGHFDHEISPEADLHPDAVARHKAVIDRQMQILYAGARQKGKRETA